MTPAKKSESSGKHALLIMSGMLLTRVIGLCRQMYFARYFGQGAVADAFSSAFRIPNLLQNLFGEGVLSASFIPVYSRLLAEGEEEEAGRVAGAIASILALIVAGIVLAGVLAAPWITAAIASGLKGGTQLLAVQLVRILFPGAGLLVLSAWCLGILNSHRKFFLSYTAPILWNLAMIGTLIVFRGRDRESLVVLLAWGSVAGSALQFGIQLPVVLRLARHLRVGLATDNANVRTVIRNFVPVFISRGVVQLSAFVDITLATWLPEGTVAAMTNAQTLYTLPVSLFGMAVSAAELPAMSAALGDAGEVAGYLRRRLDAGLRQIAFFVVPSSMGFVVLGGVISAALFQRGVFTAKDSVYVWRIVAGSAVGLLAQTLGRLYSSTFYALRDTRTPLRFAMVRVTLTTVLGYLCAFPIPRLLGVDPHWGATGLTVTAGIAGWVEFTMLRRTLNRRIGQTGLPASLMFKLWTSAAIAAAAAWAVNLSIHGGWPVLRAVPVLGAYGAIYFGMAYLFGIEECTTALRRVLRRR